MKRHLPANREGIQNNQVISIGRRAHKVTTVIYVYFQATVVGKKKITAADVDHEWIDLDEINYSLRILIYKLSWPDRSPASDYHHPLQVVLENSGQLKRVRISVAVVGRLPIYDALDEIIESQQPRICVIVIDHYDMVISRVGFEQRFLSGFKSNEAVTAGSWP